MPKIYTIDSEAVVNQPIEKVFEFFSRAENPLFLLSFKGESIRLDQSNDDRKELM